MDIVSALAGDDQSSQDTSGTTTIDFSAGPFGANEFRVVGYRGSERLSKCYSFEVSLVAEPSFDEAMLEPAMLGQSASLTVSTPAYTRAFSGIVVEAKVDGSRHHDDRWGLTVRFVPRLWLLRRTRNSRVFQNKTVKEIVDVVLETHKVQRDWLLTKQYPKREYCVQYQESDYDFVSRILAEAGISFYFEQPPPLDDDGSSGAGGIGGIVQAGLSMASSLGGPLGGLAASAAQEIPTERMQFVDSSDSFPAIDDVDDSSVGSLISSAIGSAAGALGSALGGMGGAVGSAVGSVVGSLSVKTVSPKVFYQPDAETNGDGEFVTVFSLARQVRPKLAVVRIHDATMPSVNTTSTAGVDTVKASASLSVGLSGGRPNVRLSASVSARPQADTLTPSKLEVYEHHNEYLKVDWQDERNEGRRLLNQQRSKAWTATGSSTCARLECGKRFTLDDHLRGMVNQEYIVTRLRHEGHVNDGGEGARGSAYHNDFDAAPSSTSVCPARQKRVLKQTCETATVVGPSGEEIHVDEMGRVRVQFHWDREGGHDDHSSCWVRTVQSWAGPHWGTQFIPRVGMVVLVAFEGGDVDRPIVTGCVYHRTHLPPFELPEHKSRSGIRTRSTPGGQGHNELSFEDAEGKEQVYVHAQRDLDEHVRNDRSSHVGRDEKRHVGRNETITVGADRTEHVVGSHAIRVDHDYSLNISGGRSADLIGDDDTTVGGDSTVTVAGSERRTVLSPSEHFMDDDHMVRVGGSLVTMVGRADAKRSYHLHVEGTTEMMGMGVVQITAEKSLVLSCGKSSVIVGPERVEIVSPEVAISGGGAGVSLKGGKATVRGDKASLIASQVMAQSSGGTLAMAGDVQISSSAIALKSGGGGSDSVKDDSPKPTTIELKDTDGKPLAYQRFTLVMDDKSERAGITDGNGKATMFVEGSAKVIFPDIGKTTKS